jgi:hypothetical protein
MSYSAFKFCFQSQLALIHFGRFGCFSDCGVAENLTRVTLETEAGPDRMLLWNFLYPIPNFRACGLKLPELRWKMPKYMTGNAEQRLKTLVLANFLESSKIYKLCQALDGGAVHHQRVLRHHGRAAVPGRDVLVGWCRLTVSTSMFKVPVVSALES